MKSRGWDAVHHFVPTIYPNDGVGGHVVRTAQAQRDRGRHSEIFVEVAHPDTVECCHLVTELDEHVRRGDRTLFVYHVATGSRLPTLLAGRAEPLVVQHHSLTPIDLVASWAPEDIGQLALGHRQLRELAAHAVLGIGDSTHNAVELDELGFSHTTVVPVMIRPDLVPSDRPPKEVGDPAVILFVGRIAANKAHHDLISSVAALRAIRPSVHLRLVGSVASPRYMRALERLVLSLELQDTVTFTGSLSDDDLDAEYRRADVFCCLSDHEGFGMPLIEAAAYALPVVAFDAGAVAETVGDSALVLSVKDAATVATALDTVLGDTELRAELTRAGAQRLGELEPGRAAAAFDHTILALARRLEAQTLEAER